MKEKILQLFKNQPDQSYNARQLARFLDLDSAEHKELRSALKTLVRDGKLLIDREQAYSLRDENRVLKGVIKLHSEGFGFVVPESQKKHDVFIPKKYINFAMNGDHVLVESFRGQGQKYEGRVLSVLKRVHTHVAGTLEKKGGQHFVVLRDAKVGLSEVYIPQKNLGTARAGDLVGVSLVQYPGPNIMAMGEIENVMGAQSDVQNLIQSILFQHDIRQVFSNKIESKMETLPKNPPEELVDNRQDLRSVPLITIDGLTAKDFDDAVCVVKSGQQYVLYVCIADVAEYVHKGSELDHEAYERSTSTYLPDRCIPMLPHKLSNGLCSLNAHVPRYTLTAEIHYNVSGDFIKARYYKSLIKSRKRATYEEVEAYFDKTDSHDFSPEVQESLKHMKDLSLLLMQKSVARGTLGFDLPEAEVVYDGRGEILEIRKRSRLYSHKLIEEFMIAANVCVAEFFSSRDIPLLYRVHDKPDPNKMQDFLTLVHNLNLGEHLDDFVPSDFFKSTEMHPLSSYLQFAFLRSLKQAQYSPNNLGHYGLQLEDYAHFTSPIRRYPDLVVHRQLRHILEQTDHGVLEFYPNDFDKKHHDSLKGLYDIDELRQVGKHTSERERKSMDAERDALELTKVQFASRHLDEDFVGTIVRLGRFGLSVRLDPHFVDGTLPFVEMKDDYYEYDENKLRLIGRRTRRILKVGDQLTVKIVKADLETSQILLTCVENLSMNKSLMRKKSKQGSKKSRTKRRRTSRKK